MTDQQQDTNQSSLTSSDTRANRASKKWFGSLLDEAIRPDDQPGGDRGVGARGHGNVGEGSSSSILDSLPPSAGQSSAEPPSETGVAAENKVAKSFNLSKTFSPDVIANLLADMAVEKHDPVVEMQGERKHTQDGNHDGKVKARHTTITTIATPARTDTANTKGQSSVVQKISRDFVSKMEGLATESLPSPVRQRDTSIERGSCTRKIPPPPPLDDSKAVIGTDTTELNKLRRDLRMARDEQKSITMQRDTLKNERDAAIQSRDSADDKMTKDLHGLQAEATEATDELKRMTNALELVAKDREHMQASHEEEMENMSLQRDSLAEELRTAEEELSKANKLNTTLSKRQSHKLSNLEDEVADLEEECQAQQAKAGLLETKNKVLEESLQEKTKALSKMRTDLASRDEELKDLRSDMKEKQGAAFPDADFDDMRRRYRVLEEENGNLAEELEVATRQAEASQRDLEKAQYDIEDKDKQLDELRATSSCCDADTKELLARITEMQMEKDSLADEVAELGLQLDESFRLFTVKTAECTTLSERLRSALEETDQTDMELEDVQQELVDVQSRFNLLERENRRLRRKIGLSSKGGNGVDYNDPDGSDSDIEEDAAWDTVGGSVSKAKLPGPLEGVVGLFGRRSASAARDAPAVSEADLKAQQRAKDEEMIEKIKAELEEQNNAAAHRAAPVECISTEKGNVEYDRSSAEAATIDDVA